MKNDFLETSIILDKKVIAVGEAVKGEVLFLPKIDINIVSIGCRLVLVKTAFGNEDLDELQEVSFTKFKKLKNYKEYRYSFSFKAVAPAAYNGGSINLRWEVRTFVKLKTEAYLKIRNAHLRRYGLSYSTDTRSILDEKMPIKIIDNRQLIEVKTTERTVSVNDNFITFAFFGLFVLTVFGLAMSGVADKFGAFLLISAFLIIVLLIPHYIKKGILNSIQITSRSLSDKQFEILLNLSKNKRWIRKVQAQYVVRETYHYVVYVDGEKRRTKTEKVIFKSPKNTQRKYQSQQFDQTVLDIPDVKYEFVFDLPDQYILPTREHMNIEIAWEAIVSTYFIFGGKSKFKKIIFVERKEK